MRKLGRTRSRKSMKDDYGYTAKSELNGKDHGKVEEEVRSEICSGEGGLMQVKMMNQFRTQRRKDQGSDHESQVHSGPWS